MESVLYFIHADALYREHCIYTNNNVLYVCMRFYDHTHIYLTKFNGHFVSWIVILCSPCFILKIIYSLDIKK